MEPFVNLIPESAPFNAEQRAWLNGFFAGWLGLATSPATAMTTGLTAPASPATQGPDAPPVAEDFPWHDPALPLPERMRLAGGKPLSRRLMASMAQLDCGACGYVCQTYAEAIASRSETNLTLCAPGGSETTKMLRRLLKEQEESGASANGRASTDSRAERPRTEPEGWSRNRPFPARLIRSVNLNGPGSSKRTHHVEIDLSGSHITYEVGDALGVVPTNCPDLVDAVLEALGASGDEPAAGLDGSSRLLREALRQDRCLAQITEDLLRLLAAAARDAREADLLRGWIDDDGSLPTGFDVLDVLQAFPSARPEPAAFAASLSPLAPRLYSISCSPKRFPGQVHLTVGRVETNHHGRTRKGVASTMLCDRLAPGETVGVFVQKSHNFTLPADPAAPMIMIGPGTGIAPFRAFLQERAEMGASGQNWLFFGDQRRGCDFLYETELHAFLDQGILTRLETAFSRDQVEKIYVQHRLIAEGAEVVRWLEEGAYLFVCGDARRMARDVDQALQTVVRGRLGLDEEAAADYVRRLAAEGRYRRDVY